MSKTVVVILVDQRHEVIALVQDILTDFGCFIGARLGLHDVDKKECHDEGLILVQFCGSKEKCEEFVTKLNDLERVKAKKVEIGFD